MFAAIYSGQSKVCNVICEDIKSIKPYGTRFIELSDVETLQPMFKGAAISTLKNKSIPNKITERLSRRVDQSAVSLVA